MGFSEGVEMFSNKRSLERGDELAEGVSPKANMSQLSDGSHFRTGNEKTFENMKPVIENSFGPAMTNTAWTRN